MTIIQVKGGRDPFTRASLMRESLNNHLGLWLCEWCGQRRPTMYEYWYEDDSRQNIYKSTGRPFCSIGCWREYTYDITMLRGE